MRQAVDAVNPAFQVTVYPMPGTLFTIEAFMPEPATEQAPLIGADSASYARGTGEGAWLAHEDGIRANRHRILKKMKLPHVQGMPHLYMGRIDPIAAGGDPEFCAKNAVSISEITNGYWVFYEGADYKTTHWDYFKWFKAANQAIAAGHFEFWREPRTQPDPNVISADPNTEVALHRFETQKPKLGHLGCPRELLEDIRGYPKTCLSRSSVHPR